MQPRQPNGPDQAGSENAIQNKLGIVAHANSDLADLEMETKPEDVLAEIHRLREREHTSKASS